jgi:hypothetical protein
MTDVNGVTARGTALCSQTVEDDLLYVWGKVRRTAAATSSKDYTARCQGAPRSPGKIYTASQLVVPQDLSVWCWW